MTREQLEHLIRACGTIVDDDIVVIGSQALLGSFPDAPKALLRSMEADVYPRTSPNRADDPIGARTGWCREPHDLMLAKLTAGRDRDWEFVEEALRHDLVNIETLRERLEVLPISHREHVRASLSVVIVRAAR